MAASGSGSRQARLDAWCWVLQRSTAAILALCVVVHLAGIVVAVRGGLSGAEILARTRGHGGWAVFYTVFALSVALHAPLGLRPVLAEWLRLRGRAVDGLLAAFAVLLAVAGLNAIRAVVSTP